MVSERARSVIPKLPVQDYSNNPRSAYGFVGETSLLRPIDPTDKIDMERVRVLQDKQQEDFFIKEDFGDRFLINWIKARGVFPRKDDYLVFGIAGDKGKKDGVVVSLPSAEKGELQGWLYLAPKGKRRTNEMVKKGIFPPPLEGQPPLEMAFIKHPDSRLGGQIASAMRQTCALVGQLDYAFHAKRIQDEAKSSLGLQDSDVSDPANLVKIKQKEEELWRKHDMKPTQTVYATISPRNPASMIAAEAAGFVRAQEMTEGTSDPLDYVYVLDWDKLHEKMQKNAMGELKFKEKDVKVEKSKAPYPFKLEFFDPANGSWDELAERLIAFEKSILNGKTFTQDAVDNGTFANSENTILFAKDGKGKTIGYAWAAPAQRVYESEQNYESFQGRTATSNTAYLYGIGLQPEHRGKGYVVGILEGLEKKLLERGYARMQLDARIANGFAGNIIENNKDRIISHHEHDSPFGKQEFIDMWIQKPV